MDNLIWYRCEHCGWQKESDGHYEQCPICGSNKLITEVDTEDEAIVNYLSEALDNEIIAKMKENIKELGNDKTWEVVESWHNPMTRLNMRQYFFQAGGRVPDNRKEEV